MRERPTARVLLLDPESRILLMRGRLPSAPDGPSYWFTIGGGMEPGETAARAAAREVMEETGLTDFTLGPEVWYSEAMLQGEGGEPLFFKEHFFVACTEGGPLSRAGWQDLEHRLVDELRWWSVDELRLTDAQVFPEGLAELMEDVLAGRFAQEPLVIRTLEGPVRPPPRAE